MSFTRFHDDPYRIKKQLEETTFTGRYMLNTPGQGVDLPFVQDPQLRLQKWGANLRNNTVNLESDLMGLTRPLNRDLVNQNNHTLQAVSSSSINYKDAAPIVDETRTTHPAWKLRGLEQSRWEQPILDPQANLEKKFPNNLQTRILEKDHFKPKVPVVNSANSFYLTGSSICTNGKIDKCV